MSESDDSLPEGTLISHLLELRSRLLRAAIAVLIMAFLGAAMWFAFSHTMNTAQSKVDQNVSQLGSDQGAGTGGVGGS